MRKKSFKLCSIIAFIGILGLNTTANADLLSSIGGGGSLSSTEQNIINGYTNQSSSQGFYNTYAPQYYQSAQYLQQAGQSIGSGLNLQSLASGNFNLQGLLGGGIGSIYSQVGNMQGIIQQLSSGSLANLSTGNIVSQISQSPMTLLSFASPTIANSLQNAQNQATKIYSSSLNSYQGYVNKSSLGNGITAQGTANSMVQCIQQNTSSGMDLNTALSKCSQSQLTPQYVPLTANNNNQLASSMNITQDSAQIAGLNGTEQNIYTYYVGNISINNGQVQADIKQNPVLSAYNDYSKYYGSLVVGAMKDPNNTTNLQQIGFQTGVTITPDLILTLSDSPDGTLYANQLGSQIAIERIKKDMTLVNSALGVSIQKAKTQGNDALVALLRQRQETLNKQFADYAKQDTNANIAQIALAAQKSFDKSRQNGFAESVDILDNPYSKPSLNTYQGQTNTFSGQEIGQNVADAINNSIMENSLIKNNQSTYQQNLSAVQQWNQ
jgi:hypothetical protein